MIRVEMIRTYDIRKFIILIKLLKILQGEVYE